MTIFIPFTSRLIGFMRKVVDLTTLNILRITRAMRMNFCSVNTPRCKILISGCKVFCLLWQIFVCEKVRK